jgi:hypothetical protein
LNQHLAAAQGLLQNDEAESFFAAIFHDLSRFAV